MKYFCLAIWGVIFIFTSAVHADLQMSSGSNYGSYTITGGQDYFDVYLRFGSSNASVTAFQGWVWVTDMGVTAKQNHLFRVTGYNGAQFQIPNYGWITEVLDTSMSRIGVYSDELDPAFHADAGGPYAIGPGQSLTLDASLSYLAKNHGWNPGANTFNSIYPIWKIDGKSVGSTVSFNTLTNNLGLSFGTHTVSLDAEAAVEFGLGYPFIYDDSAVSTIQIVPEPATMLLLGLGGMMLRRKH